MPSERIDTGSESTTDEQRPSVVVMNPPERKRSGNGNGGIKPEDISLALDLAEKERGHTQQQGSPRKHARLLPVDLAILGELRIRIGGYDLEGNPVPYDDDIRRYQAFESPFADWVDQLKTAAADPHAVRDDNGVSDNMRAAIRLFNEQGGHSGRLSSAQLEYLLRDGIIVYIERVRGDLVETLATVCALSRAPWTDDTFQDHKPRVDGLFKRPGLHATWPNYDLRDVAVPEEAQSMLFESANTTIVIVRSSVRGDMRRLGLAALGKDVIFHVARHFGSDELTFNIGSVGMPGQKRLNMGNKPSEGHNSWVEIQAWRQIYHTRLAEWTYKELLRRINMYWVARRGDIADGINEFEQPGGLLEGKGHNIAFIHSVAQNAYDWILRDIEAGRHSAW